MRALQAHTMRVSDLAFAPDGRSLASCSPDGTVRLLDAATGEVVLVQVAERREFEPRRLTSSGFDRVAFTGDGRGAVCRSATGELNVYDVTDPARRIALLRRTPAQCECGLAVSWAGGLAAANNWFPEVALNAVRLWDTATWGERVLHFTGEINSLSGLAFDPAGERLATNVGVFDVTTEQRTLEALLAGDVLKWSPTDPLIACAEAGEGIEVIDANTADPVASLPFAERGIPQFAFSPDGRYLAAVRAETVQAWETRNWTHAREFAWEVGRLTCLAFSPDGLLAACGNARGQIFMWDWDL